MKIITRRLASAIVGGGLAVASLSGCGLLGGDTCSSITDAIEDVRVNLSADPETFAPFVDELRSLAEGTDDAELEQAILDYADLSEEHNVFLNEYDPDAGPPETAPDTMSATALEKTIDERCSVA